MGAPKFYNIQSLAHPGYNLTHRANQVMLAAENPDDPYQFWYIDESWKFLNKCPVVLINHGSKKALHSPTLSESWLKVTMTSYDPTVKNDNLFWVILGTPESKACIALASNRNLAVDLGESSTCQVPVDSVSAILVDDHDRMAYPWKFILYVPSPFNIKDESTSRYMAVEDNCFDVVGIVSTENLKKDNMIWYWVPAGGQDDDTDAFIIISKLNGLALKGSTKDATKVVLREYDVLNYDFVWAAVSQDSQYSINLSKAGPTKFYWHFPEDSPEDSPEDILEDTPEDADEHPPMTVCSLDKTPSHSWSFDICR